MSRAIFASHAPILFRAGQLTPYRPAYKFARRLVALFVNLGVLTVDFAFYLLSTSSLKGLLLVIGSADYLKAAREKTKQIDTVALRAKKAAEDRLPGAVPVEEACHFRKRSTGSLMFLDHFGLREQPFGVTPDPHFLYFSPSHLEALASLFYGIQTRRGFMALIAKPGTGKTTLLFHLLELLRKSARTAFLFQKYSDSRDFLRSLMSDLGINVKDEDPGRMYSKFNEVLGREARAGKRVVVVIDEAQNLGDSIFETVRMLSNFEIPGMKLMQILLAGQPQLADRLASRNLVQLRQRISILSRLAQLNSNETAKYVNHRLQVAGYRGKPLFAADALKIIHSRSDGIPRNINNLCFHALTLGFAIGQKTIDAAILGEVLEDLDITMLGSNASTERLCGRVRRGELTTQKQLAHPKWSGQRSVSDNVASHSKIIAEHKAHGEQKSTTRDGPWSASKWIAGNHA